MDLQGSENRCEILACQVFVFRQLLRMLQLKTLLVLTDLGGNKIRLTQTYSVSAVPRQKFFVTPRPQTPFQNMRKHKGATSAKQVNAKHSSSVV